MGNSTVTHHCARAAGANLAAAILMLLTAGAALAQEKGCVELKTTAEIEQEFLDEQGRKARRIAPASKVLPGDEVIWTITAKNVCNAPAEHIVIANPVPDHMRYVADSAMGVGADIAYSLDGKEFRDTSTLQVREADGSSRPARADEYRAIRWTYNAPFGPGATAFVRYRAIVN